MMRSAFCRAAALMTSAGLLLVGILAAPVEDAAPAPDSFDLSAVTWKLPTAEAAPSEPLRFLLRLPSAGVAAVLTGSDGTKQTFRSESDSVVLSALPGSYMLTCGERSASLTVTASGVTVRSGPASWDGERLTFGDCATLELYCTVSRDAQRLLTVQTAAGTQTLPAAFDPLADSGAGCEVVHILTLPAGSVTVSDGTAVRSAELSPGETCRLVF